MQDEKFKMRGEDNWKLKTLIIPKAVQKQLDNICDRISAKVQQLAKNPRPDGVTKLKGVGDEYRIRIGDYRVRYEINDTELIALLLQCKHRKDVYKN